MGHSSARPNPETAGDLHPLIDTYPLCLFFAPFFQRPLFCEGIFVSSSFAKGFCETTEILASEITGELVPRQRNIGEDCKSFIDIYTSSRSCMPPTKHQKCVKSPMNLKVIGCTSSSKRIRAKIKFTEPYCLENFGKCFSPFVGSPRQGKTMV